MSGLVKVGEIPYTDVDLTGITSGARELRTVASAVRDGTADVVTAWQPISGVYSGPADEQLYAVMTPIGPHGTSFGDNLDTAAKALDDFVTEVTPIIAKLKSYVTRGNQLHRDVAAFTPKQTTTQYGNAATTESWDQDETLNDENNAIINGVAAQVVAYQAAERTCANTIRGLSGLPPLHSISADGKDDGLGYGYDALPAGTKLPWGAASDRKESCSEKTVDFLPNMVKGVLVDGVWGTLKGLGTLVGLDGTGFHWDTAAASWSGILALTGLDTKTGRKDPELQQKAWTELLKATVGWDEWGKDPGRAFGQALWGIGSIVIPVAGEAGKVGAAGKVGEVAGVVGKAGKVLDLVDAGAWASKGLTAVLPKLGDLKNIISAGLGDALHGFSGKIADFKTGLGDFLHGHHGGDVDVPPVRSEAGVDANANAHAGGSTVEAPPVREPELVGAGGHGESTTTTHGGGSESGSTGGAGHSGSGHGADADHGVGGRDGADDATGTRSEPDGGDKQGDPTGGQSSDATGDRPLSDGAAPPAYSHVSVDSAGNDVGHLVADSGLSPSQLHDYLQSQWPRDGALARQFESTGVWPHDVQIPKGPEVLTADGKINWDGVDNEGFASRPDGTVDRTPYDPPVGSVLDRYGPPDGRFTSPVPESGPYPYDERGLPYLEDPHQYHRYEVVRDVGDLRGAYDALDGEYKDLVDALLKNRGKSPADLASLGTFRGDIAAVDRFGSPGGGVQVQLPLPVEILKVLGVLRELP
ncbi:TNT domain-containing protein [Curtobacterium sp. 'Ferrero']|uniref:TNT domain-containing protein n=1 Tax=Curtobacterium sp. 'Ferrero' TaxID=2033654 RepID=UPI001596D5F2|nr:TNT domain-containing protein [Curtobacterium sp. 'Ferrero']